MIHIYITSFMNVFCIFMYLVYMIELYDVHQVLVWGYRAPGSSMMYTIEPCTS